jgi:hypothetical protein
MPWFVLPRIFPVGRNFDLDAIFHQEGTKESLQGGICCIETIEIHHNPIKIANDSQAYFVQQPRA